MLCALVGKMKTKFLSCDSGTTAIEFALILPALLLIIMGSIELSLYMFVQSSMEGASFSVSRLGKTGYTDNGSTREQTIRDALEDKLGFFLDTRELQIESKTYDNFSSVEQPEPYVDANDNGVRDDGENFTDMNGNGQFDQDRGALGPGDSGEVVVYTVSYPWHVMTPFLTSALGENGVVTINSRFVVKNEPFNDD